MFLFCFPRWMTEYTVWGWDQGQLHVGRQSLALCVRVSSTGHLKMKEMESSRKSPSFYRVNYPSDWDYRKTNLSWSSTHGCSPMHLAIIVIIVITTDRTSGKQHPQSLMVPCSLAFVPTLSKWYVWICMKWHCFHATSKMTNNRACFSMF